MSEAQTFRRVVFERMRAALGVPEVSVVESGELYRWTLRRPRDLCMFVTMDSPEREDIAHVMISDGAKYQDRPIISTILYTMPEVEKLIQRILAQWRGGSIDPAPLPPG